MTPPRDLDEPQRLRPQMGKPARARDRVATGSLATALLVRHGHGRRGPGRARHVHVPSAAPGFAPRHNARRVVIKAHVQRLSRYGAQAAARHLRYIERDGVEKDGSPGVLYGPDGALSRATFEEPRLGERHQFRFIVSPEDGHDLDLTAYVRSLMGRVERDLGRRVEWVAVNHYDTDHPHAHIVVRGVDLEGVQLRMEPAYIARGMRWSAQELATDWLGPRLESEIQQAFEREVLQERLTSLDRELARLSTDQGIDVETFESRPGCPQADTLARRLEQLGHLGLATHDRGSQWALAEGWQEQLQDLGLRGDRLKQIHRAMTGADPAHFHVVRPDQGLPDGLGGIVEGQLVGRVVRKGFADENKGTYYALLETPSGASYHVSLSDRGVDELEPGALVTFSAKRREATVRPIDQHLARVADQHGGIFDHGRDTEGADERRAALARLRQLERLGLASLERSNRWRVAPELLEQLAQRERESPPRYRLSVQRSQRSLSEQEAWRGPVWLDQVDPKALSNHGLGADVRQALERRAEVLHALGVSPDDPERVAKLGEVERWTVGSELARTVGEAFVEQTPARFQGLAVRVLDDAYLAISDGRRFVVVGATNESRALQGREVVLERAPDGRIVVFDDHARRELGQRLSREAGAFLSHLPDGFRGEVRPAGNGAPFLVVSDRIGRFGLVPDAPPFSRDGRPDGRSHARPCSCSLPRARSRPRTRTMTAHSSQLLTFTPRSAP